MQRILIYNSIQNFETKQNPYKLVLGHSPTINNLIFSIFNNEKTVKITKNNTHITESNYDRYLDNGTYIINIRNGTSVLFVVVG